MVTVDTIVLVFTSTVTRHTNDVYKLLINVVDTSNA